MIIDLSRKMNEAEDVTESRAMSEMIDTETGEIIARDKVTMLELPQVVRTVRRLRAKLAEYELYRTLEVSRINESVAKSTDGIEASLAFLESVAHGKLEAAGERSINYPGLGRVRFRKRPDTLIRQAFDSLPTSDQMKLAERFPVEFEVVTTVKPKAKEIKTVLNTDDANTNMADVKAYFKTYFDIKQGVDVFEIKEEIRR